MSFKHNKNTPSSFQSRSHTGKSTPVVMPYHKIEPNGGDWTSGKNRNQKFIRKSNKLTYDEGSDLIGGDAMKTSNMQRHDSEEGCSEKETVKNNLTVNFKTNGKGFLNLIDKHIKKLSENQKESSKSISRNSRPPDSQYCFVKSRFSNWRKKGETHASKKNQLKITLDSSFSDKEIVQQPLDLGEIIQSQNAEIIYLKSSLLAMKKKYKEARSDISYLKRELQFRSKHVLDGIHTKQRHYSPHTLSKEKSSMLYKSSSLIFDRPEAGSREGYSHQIQNQGSKFGEEGKMINSVDIDRKGLEGLFIRRRSSEKKFKNIENSSDLLQNTVQKLKEKRSISSYFNLNQKPVDTKPVNTNLGNSNSFLKGQFMNITSNNQSGKSSFLEIKRSKQHIGQEFFAQFPSTYNSIKLRKKTPTPELQKSDMIWSSIPS